MKTKTIPFDIELAKKIQSGEIVGSIKTKNGLTCKIVSYCDGTDFFVERKTEAGYCRWCYPYTKDGRYIDGHNNGGTDYDLVLEVADDISQELQFNLPYSIEQLDKLKEYTKQLMEVNQGVIDDLSSIIQETEKICNLPLKTEFKPFDKVLVRDKNKRWYPRFYAETDGLLYYTTDSKNWEECIPYKGNEHLIGTTDKPKEK